MPEDKSARVPAEAEKAPKRSPVLLMAVGSLVMIGLAWGGVHFVLKPLLHPDPTQAHEGPAEEDPGAHGEKGTKGEKGEIVRFEGIIVNPSGTMGSRYLSTTVGLEVSNEATRVAVTDSEPAIKDALITHLSARTIEELTDPALREQMRSAIRDVVNERIAPHQVSAVFFLDFVLQ